MSVGENVAMIRERMASACHKAGRDPANVRLVAVSKYVDTERMAQAAALGIRHFGENHAQEVREKQTFFEIHGSFVHFIGQLQTNKIKYVCGFAGLIESIDRAALAEAVQKRAASLGVVQDVLLQVNIGGEAQKGGCSADEVEALLETTAACESLRVRGLMCVPPALPGGEVRPYFARMRSLYEGLRERYGELPLDTLSMGMSHDYETAIEEGATEVRIGSALFGVRDKL